VTVEWLPGFG